MFFVLDYVKNVWKFEERKKKKQLKSNSGLTISNFCCDNVTLMCNYVKATRSKGMWYQIITTVRLKNFEEPKWSLRNKMWLEFQKKNNYYNFKQCHQTPTSSKFWKWKIKQINNFIKKRLWLAYCVCVLRTWNMEFYYWIAIDFLLRLLHQRD